MRRNRRALIKPDPLYDLDLGQVRKPVQPRPVRPDPCVPTRRTNEVFSGTGLTWWHLAGLWLTGTVVGVGLALYLFHH